MTVIAQYIIKIPDQNGYMILYVCNPEMLKPLQYFLQHGNIVEITEKEAGKLLNMKL